MVKTTQAKNFMERLTDIPTLPVVAMKVNELINDPASSSGDVAVVLKSDQVLTAKILKLANSSYYSIPGGVADVKRALAFLGFNTIAQLVLGISVYSMFKRTGNVDFPLSDFWRHALAVAVASETVARKFKTTKPEEAFTCGLLHDIGKLVMYEIDSAMMLGFVREAKNRKISFVEAEREKGFIGHDQVGEAVADRWGLPKLIQTAIRHHHYENPSQLDAIPPAAKMVTQTVRLANILCVKNKMGLSGDFSTPEVREAHLVPLNIKFHDVEELEMEIIRNLEKAGDFLNVQS